jgi:HAD superfamily hydrolase (TIGR01509 family)
MRAVIFDLDGTLVDSVYGHVIAWQKAFLEADLPIEGWRIHRHVGMSGDRFVAAVLKERGWKLPAERRQQLDKRHTALLHQVLPRPAPLPGALELLQKLRREQIPHGLATSGNEADAEAAVKELQLGRETVLVYRHDAAEGKPEPDLFVACQERLGVPAQKCYAIGDATWDVLAARQAGMTPIAVLSGGYGQEELRSAGAVRIFKNVAGLLENLEQLGLKRNDLPRLARRRRRSLGNVAPAHPARHAGPEVRRLKRSPRTDIRSVSEDVV